MVWLKREKVFFTFTAGELTIITLYLHVGLKVLSSEMDLAKRGLIQKVLIKGRCANFALPLHPVRAL
jgi:hypothetical protein